MADLFGTAVSGLLAFQRALNTTSHNIANVNTPGYSRQRVELGTRMPDFVGGSYMGNGVSAQTVRRVYDQFLTEQVRNLTSSQLQDETLHRLSSQLDNLLADPQAGLAPVMDDFFTALQDLADDPSSTTAREVVLGRAESLTSRFHSFHQRFEGHYEGVNTQLATAVDEINGLAGAIAEVNREILNRQSALGEPNDLLDRRDELIRRLAEYTSVSTVEQGDGTYNVFVGTGQSLVVGGAAQRLVLTADPHDPQRRQIGYATGSGVVDVTRQLTGGKLGGVLAFREQVLDPAYNRLGQVAIGLAETMNAQHRLGQDLDGALGGDLFAFDAPVALARADNTGDAELAVNVGDVSALTISDYRLSYDGSAYTLTRLGDGSAVYTGSGPIAADGLEISVASGAMGAGDSFLIRPTRGAAESIDLAFTDPRKLAVAAPIRTSSSYANAGDGVISAGVVTAAHTALGNKVTIEFSSATEYEVLDHGTTPPTSLATVTGFTSGDTISYNGWSVEITGTPAAGDTFTVEHNADGVGDNRNALLLGGLQTARTLDGGGSTFRDAYGNLVSAVGVRTERAQMASESQEMLLSQAVAAKENVSGVNLDEEAANLLRYQQAYQAAAQVIGVANTLFESILDALRR